MICGVWLASRRIDRRLTSGLSNRPRVIPRLLWKVCWLQCHRNFAINCCSSYLSRI